MMEAKPNWSGAVASRRTRIVSAWLIGTALMLLALAAGSAQAQVPQDVTFRGRLVDGTGTPQPGPVNLELRVFDAASAGTELYAESHAAVALDATGAFSVQLGMGSPLSGTFDAALFSNVDRWVEVVVGGQVLSPRQIVSSVPWALIAQQANEIVRDPSAPRYEDCGDGTVADHQTVLQWEKKTGTSGDRSYVNDRYSWSFTGTAPDGDIFTVFLADLNDQTSGAAIAVTDDTVGCLGRRCDWRLPTSVELLTIAESPPVNFPARIDPIFGPTFSSAISGAYWTASTTSTPTSAHLVDFYYSSTTASTVKTSGAPGFPFSGQYVRAVRTGSCN